MCVESFSAVIKKESQSEREREEVKQPPPRAHQSTMCQCRMFILEYVRESMME